MRLRELEIENFGVFTGRHLHFGAGFQLISGPNEAGKSTLLQLIREVFFGFPQRSPYMFAGRSGEIAATATLVLSDGRQIRYRRRKGTKAAVVGTFVDTGDPVDEGILTRLLGSANADLYSSVFGFSLAELSAAEKNLSQTDLSEALYGGGLGGLANLQTLREDIAAEQEGLFSSSARATTRQINRLLVSIREKRRKVIEATVKPRDYQKACEESQKLQQELEEVRQRREAIQRKQSHFKRLASALPSWLRLQTAQKEVSQLNAPRDFPADGEEHFRVTRNLREELAITLAQARDDADGLWEKLNRMQLRPELVANEAETKRLEQEIGRMRQYAVHIPERRQKSETIKETVLARVKQLNPAWGLAQLDQFQTSVAQRDAIESLERELQDIKLQQATLGARQSSLASEIQRKESALLQLASIESVPTLERLVECAGTYQSNRNIAAELRQQIDAANACLEILRRQLVSPLGAEIQNLAELPVPLSTTLKKYSNCFDEIRSSLKENTRRLEDAEQHAATKRRELLVLDSQARIPDRNQLLTQRGRRDAGWRLIRARYVIQDPDLNEAEVAGWLEPARESLPDQYELEVTNADQLADERQEKAQTVARREQIAAEIASATERVTNLLNLRTQLERNRDELQSQWEQIWSQCNFSPLPPDEMLEWMRLHADFLEEVGARTKQQLKLADVQLRITEFEAELTMAVGGSVSFDQQLVEARQRTNAARRAATRREEYQAELPQQKQQLVEVDQEIGRFSKRREDCLGNWQGMLAKFGFPPDWSIETATKILNGLAQARHDHSEAVSFDNRVSDMQIERNLYCRQVRELCLEIAPDLADLPAEDAVERLAELTQEAKQTVQNQKHLTAESQKAMKRIEAVETRWKKSDRDIAELLSAAGVASEAEFEDSAARASRHEKLSAEIERLDLDIKQIAAEENVEQFLAELREARQDDVSIERQRTEDEFREVESTYQDKLEQAVLARDRLEKLESASEAAQLSQELEGERSELADAVDRWAPLALAQALLSEAIERFDREYQPEMLLEISRLFSQMTGGRYVGVRRKLDEEKTLILELCEGSHKEPHELSTGTREQLYLAMRLAYVRHYCRGVEPLPLVMDDVLVNFDDERAKRTLSVLFEVAKDIQVIFMTCHRNTVDLITSAAPEIEPICLVLESIA